MSRYNGAFQYRTSTEGEIDPSTGFPSRGSVSDWMPGCMCQFEYNVPARQKIGSDGQIYQYTYTLFIPKGGFRGTLEIGTEIQVTDENGKAYSFTACGVDDLNRKYIEVWG